MMMTETRVEKTTFDAAYLARLRDRDAATLAHFCDHFYLPIRNYVRNKFARGPADDLVQDVFLAALKRIDAGQPQDATKLPAYMFGISNRLIMRGYSDARRDASVDIDTTLFPDLTDGAEVQILRALDQKMVRRLLSKLSSRDRDAIDRVFFQQQDRPTAASQMGVSQEYLRLILCRALKRFRGEWDSIH
jgi:RNA polymerase sigma factor (sigma-70 family)